MNDYISREAVLSKCQQIWSNADETTEIGVAIINIVDELANFVENIPSADVQPVKHGHWVKSHTQKHVEVTYECSECQYEVVGEYEKTPFCGGCGVRMDGVKDNNVRNLTDEETAIYESWIESESKDTGLNIMDKLNYPCDKTPNGLCVDCTNDGPLCDFDECKYMSLNKESEIQRLNGYIEKIESIVQEAKTFKTDCLVDTRKATSNYDFDETKLEEPVMNTNGNIEDLITYSNQLNTLISEIKLFQKICPKECALSIKFALDGLNAAANEITIAIEELTEK